MSPGDEMTNSAPRVLIVDDEPMIGFMLEEVLVAAGFRIAGLATKLEHALAIIESGVCDLAILDANLAGVSSEPAAVALAARRVPFLVLSGYSEAQQKQAFSGAIHLQKPCKTPKLLEALQSMMPGGLPLTP